MSAPISLHPHQHLLLSVFFITDIPVSRRWYLIVVLTCIFLAVNNIEHFSMCMCLLAICISYLEKYPFRSFAHFKIGLSFYAWVVSFLYIFYLLFNWFSLWSLLLFHFCVLEKDVLYVLEHNIYSDYSMSREHTINIASLFMLTLIT